MVRLSKGTCLSEPDGRQWKLGEEGLKPGQLRWAGSVRYGLYHGRPRELFINVALCWRLPKSHARDPRRKRPEERRQLVLAEGGWIESSPSRTQRAALGWHGCRYVARSA